MREGLPTNAGGINRPGKEGLRHSERAVYAPARRSATFRNRAAEDPGLPLNTRHTSPEGRNRREPISDLFLVDCVATSPELRIDHTPTIAIF